jgi:hypothetical protein
MSPTTGRPMRAVDFVAELLEEEAGRMPQSLKLQADSLRASAVRMRESNSSRMVRIEEIPTAKETR